MRLLVLQEEKALCQCLAGYKLRPWKHILKCLQAQGIEEVNANCLEHFLLIRADKDPQYRIIIPDEVVPKSGTSSETNNFDLTQKSDKRYSTDTISLCSAALAAML